MAFTGRLGTGDSQLGDFLLGDATEEDDGAKSGFDTGSGADDASLVTAQSAVDTGSGADDASVDTGVVVDKDDSDTGSGSDTATLAAAQAATETGTATETLLKEIDGVVSDTGTGADTGSLGAARQTADSGVGSDAAFTDTPGPADSGRAVESAHVTKFDDEAVTALALATASVETAGVLPADTQIVYDGIDITGLVMFDLTKFRSVANGGVGSASVRVKDVEHGLDFVAGRSLVCYIEGQREWSGFVSKVRRGYFFVGNVGGAPGERVRYFELSGFDYNIFFQKRVMYDKETPTKMRLSTFDPGTSDEEIIKAYVHRHSDLDADGIELGLVETVGTPSIDAQISGAAGWEVGQFLKMIRFNTGAIDYIDPDKQLVHTDVDTPTAPYGISDVPEGPFFNDPFNRAVASGWGPLYTAMDSDGLAYVTGGVGAVAAGGFAVWNVPYALDVLEGVLQMDIWIPANTSSDAFYEIDSAMIDVGAPGFAKLVGLYAQPNGDGTWRVGSLAGGDEDPFADIPVIGSSWYTIQAKFVLGSGLIGSEVVDIRMWKRGSPMPGEPLAVGQAVLVDLDFPWDPILYVSADLDEPGMVDNVTISSAHIGVREFEIEFDGEKLRNDAMCWGMGGGSPDPVFKRAISQESIDDHGLWQVSRRVPGIWKQPTIDHVAHVLVHGSPQSKRGGKDDAVAVQCVTFRRGFRVAQKAEVVSAVWDFVDVLPIRVLELDFPSKHPRFRLTLSHEIDDPWSSIDPFRFDFHFPDFDIDYPDFDIDLPPIVLPPWPDCGDPDDTSRCEETFTRSIGAGLGTTELLCSGLSWQNTDVGIFTVNGDEAVIVGTDEEAPAAWLSMPDVWDSTPVDFVARVSVTQDSPGFSSNSGGAFSIFYAANPDEDDGTNPDAFSNTQFLWILMRQSDGTVRGQVQYLVNADTTEITGIGVGENFWVRCRIDTGTASLKIWADGDAEPGAFGAVIAVTNALEIVNEGATGGSGPANVFEMVKRFNEDNTFTISNILFTSGLDCDCGEDPCLDTFPPFGDPPLGFTGEIPVRIDTPDGQDPDNSYFRTLSNFNLGSTRVTVNDTFLRLGVDYFEHDPYGDHYIEIDDSVDIPDDSAIWVTYTANPGSFVVPGIVGWGSATTGGTGGRVINCYNFADLRDALEASGPRIIMLLGSAVFDGNGAEVNVDNGDVTVDGRHWTGSMKSYRIVFRCSNVIITEVAWRPGEGATVGESNDSRAVSFNPGNEGGTLSNIVLRKSSFAWGPDVVLSFINNCTNFTVQECMIGPAITRTNLHPTGTGYGPNITTPGNSYPDRIYVKRGTFYRNLFALNRQRNMKYEHADWIDVVNNVVYGWGNQAPVHGNARGENIVNNILKKSPDTQSSDEAFEEDTGGEHPYSQYADSTYHSGNIGLEANGTPFTLDWSRISGSALRASPYGGGLHNVTAATADGALFASVVANAGRTYQDPVDTLVKAHAVAGTTDGFYNGDAYPAPHASW